MILKPEIIQACAERLLFELNYKPDLNWLTYQKLLEMAGLLMQRLSTLGAQDMIDVQSFIWVIAKY
jgi:hypothetical protein